VYGALYRLLVSGQLPAQSRVWLYGPKPISQTVFRDECLQQLIAAAADYERERGQAMPDAAGVGNKVTQSMTSKCTQLAWVTQCTGCHNHDGLTGPQAPRRTPAVDGAAFLLRQFVAEQLRCAHCGAVFR
jgi:cytochrome c553